MQIVVLSDSIQTSGDPALPLMSPATASDPEHPSLAHSIDLSQLNVSVVDDDKDMQDLIQVILEQQDMQVRVAASATKALRLFEQQCPDLSISDIGMPEMDGYSLMKHIRSRLPEAGGLVPAIALTAYAGEYDQYWAL